MKTQHRLSQYRHPLVLVVGACLGLINAVLAAEKPIRKAGAPAGLHVVFDTSASMCGYFQAPAAGSERNGLLELIRKSWIMRNPEVGNDVFVLRQEKGKQASAQRDIRKAEPTFLSQSEVLAAKGGAKGPACTPYNGAGSNLELIFDKAGPAARAEAIVLVTDAQMEDKDREKFVSGFADWAQRTVADGEQPYAGMAVRQLEFSGTYYPVADPNIDRKRAGYVLGQHERPIVIFWFARGEKHVRHIEELVKTIVPPAQIRENRAALQNVLPARATDYYWLEHPGRINTSLRNVFSDKHELEVSKIDKRDDNDLYSCARYRVENTRLLISIYERCRDGKPFFEGLAKAGIRTTAVHNRALSIKPIAGGEHFRWLLRAKMKDVSFSLRDIAVLQPVSATADIRRFSIDMDYCPPAQKPSPGATEDVCEKRLAGKAYQLDVLVQSLLTRSEPIVLELLKPLLSARYDFSVSFIAR